MIDNMQLNRPTRPMPIRPPAQDQVGITPKEIIVIIRRHLFLIITMTVLGIIAGGGGWYFMKTNHPKYTAKAAINVKPPVDQDPWDVTTPSTNKDLYYQFRFTLASYMRQQDFRQKLLAKVVIRKTKWFKQFDSDIADAVENLSKNLAVSPQKDSNWIILSMTCGDPGEAATIVNTAADIFVKMKTVATLDEGSARLGELDTQRIRISNELGTLEGNLELLRNNNPQFANLEETGFRTSLDEILTDTENNQNLLESRVAQAKEKIARLKGRLEGDSDDEIVREEVEREPIAITMRQQIVAMERNLAQQESRFGGRHPIIIEIKDALEKLNSDLDQRKREMGDLSRRSNHLAAQDEAAELTKQMDIFKAQSLAAKKRFRELTLLKAGYLKITKARDEKLELLEKVTNQRETLVAQNNNPDQAKVSIAITAPVPLSMSSPNMLVYGFGGIMLGFLTGIGLAFAIELLNDLLRTPRDIAKHLRIPLLGTICHSNEDRDVKGVDLYQVIRQAPYSMMSECYRQMRTNIRLSDSGSSKKVLFITSPGVGCGKTSIAVNLVTTLAAEGRKVLFIDTHFRNPITPTVFPRTESDGTVIEGVDFGLSNFLLGQCPQKEVARESGVENLYVIDSGPLPSNPDEILGNANMNSLLENASREYDYVIIDGPPLIVTSAKVLASQAEGTIVVFNTSLTKRGKAQRSLRELREVNANVIGTVLLGVRSMKGGYFHERNQAYRKYQKTQIPATV